MTDKGKSDPHKSGADQYKRHVDGSIRVSGQIEVHPPPESTEQENTDRDHQRTHRDKSYLVSVLTLVAVIIYAALTAWQGILTRRLVKLSQKTYDASERPYVGIKGVDTHFTGNKPDGTAEYADRPTQYTTAFSYRIGIQNFGPVPGSNYITQQKVLIGAKEIPIESHERPTTIFPTQQIFEGGAIVRPEDLQAIEKGPNRLVVELRIDYDGPSQHYIYCEKEEYHLEVNSFIDLGPQDKCP